MTKYITPYILPYINKQTERKLKRKTHMTKPYVYTEHNDGCEGRPLRRSDLMLEQRLIWKYEHELEEEIEENGQDTARVSDLELLIHLLQCEIE